MLSFQTHFETSDINGTLIEQTFESLQEESQTIGYYTLPASSLALCAKVRGELLPKTTFFDTIAVVGIGGSSLGIKAIDRLLRASTPHAKKIVYFENSDPLSIAYTASHIEIAKTLFVVISKSGGTVETLSIFKYLITTFEMTLENSQQVIVVSDEGSILSQFAHHYGLQRFAIPDNVGGRFSVLSAVGVVPLLVAGFDVEALLEGAKGFMESFWDCKEDHLLKKAAFYVHNAQSLPMNVLFSYSDAFEELGKWVVQLWGESLGKRNEHNERVGLTPISLIGSVDQHSFLQLIIEGPLNKTVTFIRIEHSCDELTIPRLSLPFLEKVDFVNGYPFNTLINAQCQATMQSVRQSGVSVDEITLSAIDPTTVGEMIIYYELLTSASGVLLGVNTYNQPGVELGKQILQGYFSE